MGLGLPVFRPSRWLTLSSCSEISTPMSFANLTMMVFGAFIRRLVDALHPDVVPATVLLQPV